MADPVVPAQLPDAGDVAPPACVRLVAQLALVAQTIAAALRSLAIEVEVVPIGAPVPSGGPPTEILLLVDDLSAAQGAARILDLIESAKGPVLVLTARQSERYWGALLARGATAVMSSAASLTDVEASIRELHGGRDCLGADERLRLVRLWEAECREERVLAERLELLTPREQTVLRGLCEGASVLEVAASLGVAETTIRTQVRSIRRKLKVRSQLAAVAVVHRLESPLAQVLNPAGTARRPAACD